MELLLSPGLGRKCVEQVSMWGITEQHFSCKVELMGRISGFILMLATHVLLVHILAADLRVPCKQEYSFLMKPLCRAPWKQ